MMRRGLVAAWMCVAAASHVAAQGVTAADQRAAGQAYDRASAAYVSGDYRTAARLYETAHRLAPSATALMQAVMAYRRDGNLLRAANLALGLVSDYPRETDAVRVADEVINEMRTRAVLITAACEGCEFSLDGTLESHPRFFVSPDQEHVLIFQFPSGSVEERFTEHAGQERRISAAPPAPRMDGSAEGPDTDPASTDGDSSAPLASSSSGLSPAFAITGTILTAIAGGLAIWSAIDTLDGVAPYNAMPTLDGWNSGHEREVRTDVMFGVTAGLGVTTLILVFLTQWSGTDSRPAAAPRAQVSVAPRHDGALVLVSGEL